MKKIGLFTLCALCTLLFASCGKDYKTFIGTWGVEKIEYFNIDYAGNPIAATIETFNYDPNDTNNGIHLIFREDKTGEMRDSAIDTIWTDWNASTQTYESYIVCPDTVVVTTFTFSYDKSESALYMNMDNTTRPFMLQVSDLSDNSFTYENEYSENYVEKAYLKRYTGNAFSTSSKRNGVKHPNKPGAFLGGR